MWGIVSLRYHCHFQDKDLANKGAMQLYNVNIQYRKKLKEEL